jgi:hypothetical protein
MSQDAEMVATVSAAAERMRRHRERRRDGMRCLTIEIRDSEVEALVRKQLLKPDARNDQNAIRDALYAYLDHTLGRIDVTRNGHFALSSRIGPSIG